MDGIIFRVLTQELADRLVGGKIEKIVQCESDELRLQIRSGKERFTLVLSASASSARIHLTRGTKPALPEAPMFCMLLRKYIGNGRISAIDQISSDRILRMTIACLNELGDPVNRVLLTEIMGRHSNIILCQPSLTIIDAIKHVSEQESRVRQISPGLHYRTPPLQEKIDLENIRNDLYLTLFQQHCEEPLPRFISRAFYGFSPQAAREACLRMTLSQDTAAAEIGAQRILESLTRYVHSLQTFGSPALLRNEEGGLEGVYAFPQQTLSGNWTLCATASEALDAYYTARDGEERIRQKVSPMLHTVSSLLDKEHRKLDIQRRVLDTAREADQLQKFGELLQANLYRIPKGASSITVDDYYLEEMPEVTIPLDSSLSPVRNVQRYFKQYQKQKNAQKIATAQCEQIEKSIAWLEQLEQDLHQCVSMSDAEELQEILLGCGILKAQERKPRKPRKSPHLPKTVTLADGIRLSVGRNAMQNEELSRNSAPGDLWFHAQKIPGSHVVLHGDPVSEEDILEAANLAACLSRSRQSANVPVDMTRIRYLKKPSGSPPGFFIYTHQQTRYVTPDMARAEALLSKTT